jgi:hypothetical protein
MHMPNKLLFAVGLASLACGMAAVTAGTIIFKDGSRISDADIVSITDGRITIEKDKTKRSFPLKSIDSYFQTNLKDGEGNDMPGEFADYSVRIFSVDMPGGGLAKKAGKDSLCTVKYSISKKGDGKVKFPYFYLYVICTRTSETEQRPIYRYCYPNEAKPKGKDYDRAAVLARLSAFDRPILGEGERFQLSGNGLAGREVTFEMSNVKSRRIIAYRLEVWGNNRLIAEKEEKVDVLEARDVAPRWWERY